MSLTESLPQRPQHTLTAHRGAVNACTFTTTGSYLLTGGQDRTIQLWNIATGDNVSVFHGHGWAVHDIAVAPTDTRFASGGGDRGVFLWDVVTCRVLRKWTGHTQRTNTVQFNAQGTVLASGSFDTTVQLWDCRSSAARPIQVLDDAKDSVTCIDINDHEVMAASVDGSCRIYDLRTGTLLTDYVGSPLSSCAFSKDNQCILLSVLDSTLRLVDRSNGSLLNHYQGHTNTQYQLRSCFSKTDSFVISGSEDGSIWCWDLMDANCVCKLEGHSAAVLTVGYHPHSSILASGAADGSVYLWQ